MSTSPSSSANQANSTAIPATAVPRLESGDRLDQATFHTRYEATPANVKAELIGGVVYLPAALRRDHGRPHSLLVAWLVHYENATPGTEVCDNTTTILGARSEPQPDAFLIVDARHGGQTRWNAANYLEGPPELIVEVALSTESYDLHDKKDDYEKAGVDEYIVYAVRQQKLFWYQLQDGNYVDLPPGIDGVFRSEKFPGLWLDPHALMNLDGKSLIDSLNRGISTAEHRAFVEKIRE